MQQRRPWEKKILRSRGFLNPTPTSSSSTERRVDPSLFVGSQESPPESPPRRQEPASARAPLSFGTASPKERSNSARGSKPRKSGLSQIEEKISGRGIAARYKRIMSAHLPEPKEPSRSVAYGEGDGSSDDD